MGRPAAFDRDTVLDAAMHVFWRKGFEATSVQDLVDATGLNRGSLYNEFDDKAGLFQAVIQHYALTAPSRALLEAVKTGAPRPTIQTFFKSLIKRAANDDDRKGCLLTNTAAELCARDAHIAHWIGDAMQRLEDGLTTLIKRGQKDGTIATDRSARTLARFLLGCAQGMLVLAKATNNPRVLKDVADTALAALD